ncbi:CCAPR-like protein [Mya arenaria]|uniref:CCAPR-like protein n=1 Tax=Mya arenaria TaxID=6604 RepID=A0ABY7EI60_MYAAR|nr:CCAPR-like protein [Mya arenaria]
MTSVPQLVVLNVLFLMIVLGNTCVLVAIYMSEKGIKTRMNYLMMHLAVADLTVGLFHLTADIVERWLVVWYGGAALCKIIKFLQVLLAGSNQDLDENLDYKKSSTERISLSHALGATW